MDARQLLLSPDLITEDAARFLQGLGFQDGFRADEHLRRMAEMAGVRERLARFLPALLEAVVSKSDPDATLTQLLAYYESVPDPANLTSYLEQNLEAVEVLVVLLGASSHLTQMLLRNPEYLYWLLSSDRLTTRVSEADLRGEVEPYLLVGGAAGLDAVRRFHRRETLRIAAQDLLGKVEFQATVEQLSSLTRVTLQTVYTLLMPENATGKFTVLAMGKLGGSELNYSSDVDLLYVYSDDSDASTMLRFARTYTGALREFTSEGRLFRVDLRLRPLGRGGQIAYPLSAFQQYYETTADTFDRLALIKCTWAAGDATLGSVFLKIAHRFAFRKYLDLAAIEEIRWLKKRSDRRIKHRGETATNVKLGFGGIREIEFFVQSFQLLYGGQNPEIRSPNTLDGLNRLVDHGLIPSRDYDRLKKAYLFLRTVEHRLQLVHDLQTHSLPADPVELYRCAHSMGYAGKGDSVQKKLRLFLNQLERTQNEVRRLFESLFQGGESGGVSDLILDSELPTEERIRRLEEEGVPEAAEVEQALREIGRAPSYPFTPVRIRNLLANLLPSLLEQCRVAPGPREFLSRFDRLCDAVGSRGEFYRTLVEDSDFLHELLRVLSAGEFLSETLIRYPELLDAVSRRETPRRFYSRLCESVGVATDRNAFLNSLRVFKRREEFKIALTYLESLQDLPARRALSALAEACVRLACERLLADRPAVAAQPFVLFSLGKLGGRELTFHSDLDLVMVYDDSVAGPLPTELDQFVRLLTEALQKYTEAGLAYQLDFRLRPEGRRSAPATPLSVFQDYFAQRAEPWERVAYIKLRSVFRNRFEIESTSLLPLTALTPTDRDQLLHIRRRKERELGREDPSALLDFKVGLGGLMDIQFVVQSLQLQHQCAESCTQTALEKLRQAGWITQGRAEILQEGLHFLFRLESVSRLLQERSTSKLNLHSEWNRLAARLLGFSDRDDLYSAYQETTARVRRVYEDLLGISE